MVRGPEAARRRMLMVVGICIFFAACWSEGLLIDGEDEIFEKKGRLGH